MLNSIIRFFKISGALLLIISLFGNIKAQSVKQIEIHPKEVLNAETYYIMGFSDETTLTIIGNKNIYNLNTNTGQISILDLSDLPSETDDIFKNSVPRFYTEYEQIEFSNKIIQPVGINMNEYSPAVMYIKAYFKFIKENECLMELFSFIKSDKIEFLWSDEHADLGVATMMSLGYFFKNDTIILSGTTLWNNADNNTAYKLLKLKKSNTGFTIADTIEFPIDTEKIKWNKFYSEVSYSDPNFRFFNTGDQIFISLGNQIYEYNNKINQFFKTKDEIEAFSIKANIVLSIENLDDNFFLRAYNTSDSSLINSILINKDTEKVHSVCFHKNQAWVLIFDKENNEFFLKTYNFPA